MSTTTKRVTRSHSKQKIVSSTQPTIAEAFAKRRNPTELQIPGANEPPLPTEPVIEVNSSPVAPAPALEQDLAPEVVVEEEPRLTTTKVVGTKRPNGSKPAKVFPLFNKPKPPATTQLSLEDTASGYPPSQPTDSSGPDEASPRASKASKPLPTKSRPKKWKSAPSNNGRSTGLTVEDPIVLDLPPGRTRSLPIKIKPPEPRVSFKPKKKRGFGSLDAPLPNGETQHVRGPQSVFVTSGAEIPFDRKSREPIPSTSAMEPLNFSLSGIINYPQDPPILSGQHATPPPASLEIPAEYAKQHPALRIFSEAVDLLEGREKTVWVDKWSPRFAENVLGNEAHALYLRDWLRASAIGSFSGAVEPSAASTSASSSQSKKKPLAKRGTKRPRIRREVGGKKDKKRRRREGDWIVDDDCLSPSELSEPEFHPLDELLDGDPDSDALVINPPMGPEVPTVNLSAFNYRGPNTSNMSNTIILCGPPGSGKSAAVDACLYELGWDVHEVYPGIGKRSGAALESLIGQAGKNHLVTKQLEGERFLSPGPKGNTLTGFWGVNSAEVGSVDGSSECTEVPDVGSMHIGPDNGSENPASPPQDDPPQIAEQPAQEALAQAKQSLILLEEVDILFKDDVNFWATVVDIIRDCRRPVVLTCNDINLLPLHQLPVQKILWFTRPPAPLVAAYLSAICRVEGAQLNENFKLQAESTVDLRQCINQCQFGAPLRSPSVINQETLRNDWEDVLEKSSRFPVWEMPPQDDSRHKEFFHCFTEHADNISYLDSCLVLRVDTDLPKTSTADDEIGHRILPTGDLTPPEFTHYHHDIELAVEVLSLTSRLSHRARSLSDASTTRPDHPGRSDSDTGLTSGSNQLDSTSSNHRSWMHQLASDLSVTAPFDRRLFLEYESVVREMVLADDYVESCIANAQEAEAAQGGQFKRMTRNSQRMKVGFDRYLSLQSDRREWLARTAFGGRTI